MRRQPPNPARSASSATLAVPAMARADVTTIPAGLPKLALGHVDELEPGDSRPFAYPDAASPCVLARLRESVEGGAGPSQDIVAFHTLCPHMGCPLPPSVDDRGIIGPCHCHFSCFDARSAGAQIQGVAAQGLARVRLEVHDGTIYAVGFDGMPFGRTSERR